MSPEIQTQINEEMAVHRAKQVHRKANYGEVRPVVHSQFNKKKVITVGNAVHLSDKWKTFPDFLYDYLKTSFGKIWWVNEAKVEPGSCHPAMRWAREFFEYQKNQGREEGDGLFSIKPNGPMMAYYSLSYDLYVLKDNQAFQSTILKRLRNQTEFPGARYELYVAATFVRAGFTIKYENEKDATHSHPEFLATHTATGITLAVEAKRRNRPRDKPDSTISTPTRLGIAPLLRKALDKNVERPFAVFIDMDLPPIVENVWQTTWKNELLQTPELAGARDSEGKDRFNIIVLTNHPVEDHPKDSPQFNHIEIISLVPNYPITDSAPIDAIRKAVVQSHKIPSKFDE
jgi:hypothetical protein